MPTPQIFDPATTTPEQMAGLTNIPGQSLTQTNTPEAIQASQAMNPSANIPPYKLAPAAPIIPGPSAPSGGTNTADAMVAGAKASVDAYTAMMTPPETPDSKAAAGLRSDIATLSGQDTGKGQAQLDADKAAGVADKKAAIDAVHAQILSRTAEYNALNTNIEGKTQTVQSSIGEEAQAHKVYAADIAMLNATSLALQGQYDEAVTTANRAVDLKYSDIEGQIKAKQAQLDLLTGPNGTLTKTEKIRADAVKQELQDQKDKLAIQTANEKDKNATLLNQMQKYPDAKINTNDTLEQANQKIIQNSKIYQNEVRLVDSSGNPIFTSTQSHKGAAVARIPIEDFNKLTPDDKNFFINNAASINSKYKVIDTAFANKDDPTAIEVEIANSNVPASVKDSLTRYLWSVFPRPEAAAKPWWHFGF